MLRRRLAGVAALLALLGLARPGCALAQGSPSPDSLARRPLATRAELDSLARALGTPDSSGGEQRETLHFLRARLALGDFQPGERILLQIPGLQSPVQAAGGAAALTIAEQQLRADTFTVGRDRELTLPIGGTIALKGVLRSELQGYLTEQLSQYLKYPMIRARPLLRVSVQGFVAKPGFYYMPADAPLAEAFTVAGGTLRDAKVKKVRIERRGATVWKGGELEAAIAAGRTLEAAGLEDGDQFVVPGRGDVSENLRFLWLVVSLAGGVYGLTRAFH